MAFKDRLKQARERSGLTQNELAIKLDIVSSKTVSHYENGIVFPKKEALIRLFAVLNVTPNFLFQDYINKSVEKNKIILSSEEIELVTKYRKLNDYGKRIIKTILDVKSEDNMYDDKLYKPEIHKKSIPLADFSISAGTGNPFPEDTYEMIDIDADKYPKADIAFKVKGDSMEPRYHNGDIVFVHKQPIVEPGEIAAFIYDDNQYIKKLVYEDGTYKFRSLNSKYVDIEIKNDSLRIYGKVIN